jgi:L-alanine-DL-glutamate epimerase-like enolase superfamily enzyme
VEEPVAEVEGLVAVRAASRVPVAADEAVRGAPAARRLIDARAVDVLVVKPVRVGGAIETLRIAGMAAEAGVPVVLSTFYETGIGLAAALHVAAALPAGDETHGIATGDLLAADLLARRPRIADGWAETPDAPGLGVETNPDLVAEFREDAAGIR